MRRAWACAALLVAAVLSSGVAQADAAVTAEQARRHPLVRRAADAVYQTGMRSDHIRRQLMRARGSKDGKRARCLDDKLSQAHAVERLTAREQSAIMAALLGGRLSAAEARSARVEAYETRSKLILQQAHACSGVSKRVRMPTTYRVRMIAPPLPPERPVTTRPCRRLCAPSG